MRVTDHMNTALYRTFSQQQLFNIDAKIKKDDVSFYLVQLESIFWYKYTVCF